MLPEESDQCEKEICIGCGIYGDSTDFLRYDDGRDYGCLLRSKGDNRCSRAHIVDVWRRKIIK